MGVRRAIVPRLAAGLRGLLLLTACAGAADAQLAVDFTATPEAGVNPLTVSFTDTSTGGVPISWQWSFGDGATSTEQHPQHTYTAPGSYTVSLFAVALSGFGQEQKEGFITVEPAPLVPDFSLAPESGTNPLTVSFTDTSTGAAITAWSWDFGDGTTSTLQHPTHTYQADGPASFTVSLTVWVAQQSAIAIKPDAVTVHPAPLVADFTATPVQGTNPVTVAFTDTSGGAVVTAWSWRFGDGATSTMQDPIHTYTLPGVHDVTLTAYVGPQADTITKRALVTVEPAPLVVDFTATPAEGANPHTVAFGDTSTGAVVTAWAWDFGDGNVSMEPAPTHTYIVPGTYDVSLTVNAGQQVGTTVKRGFVEVAHTPLALPLFRTRAYEVGRFPEFVVSADFDLDGTPDLAAANRFSPDVTVLLGQGDGGFEHVGSHVVGLGAKALVSADFDGDGVPDIATADRSGGQVGVLLGHGNGDFAPRGLFEVGTAPESIATGDFDGDGVPDLVTADTLSGQASVLLGDGSGGFVLHGTYAAAGVQPRFVAVGDFDEDGRPDLFTLSLGSPGMAVYSARVLTGHGDGSFSLASSTQVGTNPYSAALGDFDGDGHLDAAVAEVTQGTVRTLLGQGDGSFAIGPSVTTGPGSSPISVVATDIDGDGLLDLAVADSIRNFVRVLEGQGTGVFAPGRAYAVGFRPQSLAPEDFDGDGAMDVAVAIYGADTVSILRGAGNGELLENDWLPVGEAPQSVAAGDLDDDGWPDLVTANSNAGTVSIQLGQGDGEFRSVAAFKVESNPTAVVVADLDGDHVQDLATTSAFAGGGVGTLLGRGDGNFMEGPFIATGSDASDMVAGDFDGDGVTDLATAGVNAGDVTILLGVGDANFTVAGSTFVGTSLSAIAVADLDDDGDQDLVATDQFSDTVAVLLGVGDGSFASGGSYAVGQWPQDVAVGDLDEDGSPDLVTADWITDTLSILMGQGDGTFSAAQAVPVPPQPRAVAVADVDGDGHADIVTVHDGLDAASVLLGRGDGTFSDNGLFAVRVLPVALVVHDLDANGRPDVAIAEVGVTTLGVDRVTVLLNRLGVWTNLASGLPGIAGIPYLAGSGSLEPGSAGALTLTNAAPSSPAMLHLSWDSDPVPFACGTLVPAPAFASIPLQTDPDGTITIAWPTWPPGLSGQSLYLQYAVQDGAAVCGVALSNALRADAP